MLYTGVTGSIKVAEYNENTAGTASALAHMANWTVNITLEMIEVVSFGSSYKEKIPSIKDWSASSDGKADFDSANGQAKLVGAFENGTKLRASFYLDENTFLEGDCYIESLDVEHAADGAGDISISLAGSNAVELNLPGA